MSSVSTFTAQNRTRLSKEFWLRHSSRMPLLGQARLVPTSVRGFVEILAEDAPPNGPRFPSLTKLILLKVTLTALRTYHLRDMLIERAEQGAPLEVLDLRTCIAADRAIQFLAEIVVDVQKPLDVRAMKKGFKHVEFSYCDGVEYDDGGEPWYGYTDYSTSEGKGEEAEFDYGGELAYDDNFSFSL